jgi:hypothetical protein
MVIGAAYHLDASNCLSSLPTLGRVFGLRLLVYGLTRWIPGFRLANKFFEVPCRNRFPQAVVPMVGLLPRDRPMAAEVLSCG